MTKRFRLILASSITEENRLQS